MSVVMIAKDIPWLASLTGIEGRNFLGRTKPKFSKEITARQVQNPSLQQVAVKRSQSSMNLSF